MDINRINTTLSDFEQQDILSAIAGIQERLSFLIHLGSDERKSMSRLGDRNRAFTRKAPTIPTFCPAPLILRNCVATWICLTDCNPPCSPSPCSTK